MNNQQLWQAILGSLEISLSKANFNTWFKNTSVMERGGDFIIISVPSAFSRDWIAAKYHHEMLKSLKSIAPEIKEIKYQLGGSVAQTAKAPIKAESVEKRENLPANHSGLNQKYTFETFVVGQNNRFAQSAALAVAKNPSKAYNPLFIYGGVGLGKTHLLQAIAHTALHNNPNLKVVFVSSEKFTNELINAIRDGKNEAFRSYYRNIDLLLVDDIQFLAGKERTQEEFFHTFNTLHQAGKQIVLSSDRSPKEIANLEARLRSRFEWGLIADIQAPEFETRIAILRKKADADGMKIPDEVITYIASQIPSNIRELEGALVSIVAYSSLVNSELNVELAADVIKDVIAPKQSEKPITITLIKKMVAEYFHIDKEDLNAKIRTKEIALARQIAMHLSRELTNSSLPKIGEDFGGRDHTTVMHACDKIKELTSKDSSINDMVKSIENSILSASE